MTTLHEALAEFPTDRLRALGRANLNWRDSESDPSLAALANAILCGCVDVLNARAAAEKALFEDHLELLASPIRIVGVEIPGRA